MLLVVCCWEAIVRNRIKKSHILQIVQHLTLSSGFRILRPTPLHRFFLLFKNSTALELIYTLVHNSSLRFLFQNVRSTISKKKIEGV